MAYREITRLVALALAVPLALSGCAGLARNDRGVLQPQTVAGSCQVSKFFVVSLQAQPTKMTVSNPGDGCTFTVFNPDLQIVTNAALVTTAASHGQASTGLLFAGRQVSVSYRPQPGYTGPDRFSVTLEPNDRAIDVNVTVQPPAAG